jgi:FKBP-type peptidyl-prolyl cis-trans isomerase SlyD
MNAPVVTANKVISFTYLIRNSTGEICEYRSVPVTYIHGSGSDLFPEIEAALDGHEVGYKATVVLPPEQAFGDRDPDLAFTDNIENMPEELRYIGSEPDAENEQGEVRHFRVVKIEDGQLTVDANHPLAGQTLTYEVTITGIRDATGEELGSGNAAPDFRGLA